MNREYLMLAKSFEEDKHALAGNYASEKLDGMRCFWDGGLSRGCIKEAVPWANTDKDERYRQTPIATGLWSRYGNVIHAPDYVLDNLPAVPLDGELFIGRTQGERQRLMSIVKTLIPNVRHWHEVKYLVFDMPSLNRFFQSGQIRNNQMVKYMHRRNCVDFAAACKQLEYYPKSETRYEVTYRLIDKWVDRKFTFTLPQWRMPCSEELAKKELQDFLDGILAQGGEGVMIRDLNKSWEPKRVSHLLKLKLTEDEEVTIVGLKTGEETDKGSKLLGMMGSLLVRDDEGRIFNLSGFTDAERELDSTRAKNWALEHPGEIAPDWVRAKQFKCGDGITIKYRGRTADGIPMEARYWRHYVL